MTIMTSYYNRGKTMALGDPKILGLGQIIRYNNRAKIKDENVAEHSFYVVSNVLKIISMFNLSDDIKYKALEFATVHDIPEMFTGDMPYDTKVSHVNLANLLQEAEITELEKNMPEFLESYLQFIKEENEETIPYLVTKLADTVSVLQYSNLEIDLGNQTADMKLINEGSIERVHDLIEKLEGKIDIESKNTNVIKEEIEIDQVVISKSDLNELLVKEEFLSCLEANGVDNWHGYADARQMANEEE